MAGLITILILLPLIGALFVSVVILCAAARQPLAVAYGLKPLLYSIAGIEGIVLIVLLTFMNTLGLRLGKFVQNLFTITKTGALLALIILGIWIGRRAVFVEDDERHGLRRRGAR